MSKIFTNVSSLARQLQADEAGFVLSAELVLVLTLGCLSMVVGLNAVAKSVTVELNDVAQAVGAVSQSYHYSGISGCEACVKGGGFEDKSDECDCAAITFPSGNVKTGSGDGKE